MSQLSRYAIAIQGFNIGNDQLAIATQGFRLGEELPVEPILLQGTASIDFTGFGGIGDVVILQGLADIEVSAQKSPLSVAVNLAGIATVLVKGGQALIETPPPTEDYDYVEIKKRTIVD